MKPGFVYVLNDGRGAYKIGMSRNPGARIWRLQRQMRGPLLAECLITADNPRRLEMQLHAKFADKRLQGEWFRLLPEDVQTIRRELAEHLAPCEVAIRSDAKSVNLQADTVRRISDVADALKIPKHAVALRALEAGLVALEAEAEGWKRFQADRDEPAKAGGTH